MTIFDFSREITDLRKVSKFSEALDYFKSNKGQFTKSDISNNAYLISNIIHCLRKTNNLDAGFKFLDMYEIKITGETQERILTAYGWLLWAKYKAENANKGEPVDDDHFFDDEEHSVAQEDFHYEKSEFLERIDVLLGVLLEHKNEYTKTLISNLLTIVLKSEKNKAKPNWRLVNDFLCKINPELLSQDCSTIEVERKGRRRDMELASDLENWYAYKTKALVNLLKWQECYDISKEALDRIDTFHYSNDIWFARRIAISKKNLGDVDAAIIDLEAILKKKKEWFIQKELAELYFEKGDVEHALKLAMMAINNFGPLEYKVDLLFLIGRILASKNERELAFKHFTFSRLIRQQNGWKISPKLLSELKNCEIETDGEPELKSIEGELKKYWKRHNFRSSRKSHSGGKVLQGQIVKILNDNERGKNGFVSCNGKDYYFALPVNFDFVSRVVEGTKVEFSIVESRDNKKQKARIQTVL